MVRPLHITWKDLEGHEPVWKVNNSSSLLEVWKVNNSSSLLATRARKVFTSDTAVGFIGFGDRVTSQAAIGRPCRQALVLEPLSLAWSFQQ